MKNEYAKDINISRHDFVRRTFWKVNVLRIILIKIKSMQKDPQRLGLIKKSSYLKSYRVFISKRQKLRKAELFKSLDISRDTQTCPLVTQC